MASHIYSFTVAISDKDIAKLRSGDSGPLEAISHVISSVMAIDDMGARTTRKARDFVLFGDEMPEPVFINLVGDA